MLNGSEELDVTDSFEEMGPLVVNVVDILFYSHQRRAVGSPTGNFISTHVMYPCLDSPFMEALGSNTGTCQAFSWRLAQHVEKASESHDVPGSALDSRHFASWMSVKICLGPGSLAPHLADTEVEDSRVRLSGG